MPIFEGAIDYLILKDNDKYIVFFLDNHNPSKYCDIKSENISKLFQEYLNKNTTFIFEELVDESNFFFLFQNVPHLKEYLDFYNKHKKKNNIHPVDLRIIFNDIDNKKIFNTMEHFFNIFTPTNINNDININKSRSNCKNKKFHHIVNKINEILINDSHSHLSVFKLHLISLYTKFQQIKQLSKKDHIKNILVKNNEQSFFSKINLNYPFNINDEINESQISEEYNDLLSAFLEFYTISIILNSNSNYIFVYLGASHCISIFNILHKFYKFRILKSFKHFNLHEMDYFLLDNFNNLYSCIEFNLHSS
jgi:hypothetical protein